MRHLISSAESFSQQWAISVTSLPSSLERNDALQVSRWQTFQDILGLLAEMQTPPLSTATPHELTELRNALEKLNDFIDFVSNQAKPPIDNCAVWGLVGLVLHLSRSDIGVAPRVPCMMRSICQKLDFLQEKTTETLPEMRDTCFHIANSLLPFLVTTIKFIRQNLHYFATDKNVWEPLEQQFQSCRSEIDDAISRVEKVSMRSSPRKSDEPASLPCFIYPTTRTHRFFDREDVIIQMDRFFNNRGQDYDQPFRSLVLHGIAGIGKSSVALQYAEGRIRREELDAMFWISGEKTVDISQSFSNIAVRLKLPGANPRDHDQNKTLTMDWLQNTKCKWLLIFDNVESVDLLMEYWPIASRGQAVVTSRHRSLAFNPCDGGLEIKEWDTYQGSQFLRHLLSTDISDQLTKEEADISGQLTKEEADISGQLTKEEADISGQLTKEEADSAQELARTVSGHALALSLMAGLIHGRSWSIKEFVELFKRQPQEVYGIFGNNSINELWDMPFRNLNERSRAILGVLAFLSPDSIPQTLFEPRDGSSLPDSLAFCIDQIEFSASMGTLMSLALVRCNKEKREFSIHRLVQASFRHFMGPENSQQSFKDAVLLVSAAFPRKDAEFAQMYQLWQQCSLFLPHALSLRDSFREEKKANSNFSAPMEFCSLNNACQRFLIETHGYNDLLDLLEVNAMAMRTIPAQPRSIQIDLEGGLASHTGLALIRVGRADEGVKQLRLAYNLFATDEPRNLREEAWCAENLADGLASTNNFIEAVRFQEIARDHWLEWAKDNSEDKTEWPAILKWGMGTNLAWAGENHRARDLLMQGLKQLEAAKPFNWATAAYTNYSLGTVDRSDGDFQSAEKRFTEAYNHWISGDNLLSDPFCGACVYRIGCAALDQGKIDTATKHLREACSITGHHQASMPVEHARSLLKLSEALAKEPRDQEESARLRKEATRLLLSRCPGAKDIDKEKTYDDLIVIVWR